MKINTSNIHYLFQVDTKLKPPSFTEYCENKEVHDAEVKQTIEKVQDDLCDLKALLAQILSIRKDKDVS